jgi:hypothetical protein
LSEDGFIAEVIEDHDLRRINGVLNFGFVREALAARYSPDGRPSIDPELMLRMLLIAAISKRSFSLLETTTSWESGVPPAPA